MCNAVGYFPWEQLIKVQVNYMSINKTKTKRNTNKQSGKQEQAKRKKEAVKHKDTIAKVRKAVKATGQVVTIKRTKAEIKGMIQRLKVICWNLCPSSSDAIAQAYRDLIALYADYPQYFSPIESHIIKKLIAKKEAYR